MREMVRVDAGEIILSCPDGDWLAPDVVGQISRNLRDLRSGRFVEGRPKGKRMEEREGGGNTIPFEDAENVAEMVELSHR